MDASLQLRKTTMPAINSAFNAKALEEAIVRYLFSSLSARLIDRPSHCNTRKDESMTPTMSQKFEEHQLCIDLIIKSHGVVFLIGKEL